METVWETLRQDLPGAQDVASLVRGLIRLILAALLGGMLGYERNLRHRPAGLRTHMLVALGSAFFVLVPQQAGMPLRDLSRVIQGLLTGIGFLGSGAILKRDKQGEIFGLTTAAGIWMTAGVGMAAGLGRLALALLGALLALLVLGLLRRIEAALGRDSNQDVTPSSS